MLPSSRKTARKGSVMTSLDYHDCLQLSWGDVASGSSEAVNGFALISDHLDQAGQLHEIGGTSASDILAIVMGWVVLGLVIYYPAIQIAAIIAAVTLFAVTAAIRSLTSVLRQWPHRWSPTPAGALAA